MDVGKLDRFRRTDPADRKKNSSITVSNAMADALLTIEASAMSCSGREEKMVAGEAGLSPESPQAEPGSGESVSDTSTDRKRRRWTAAEKVAIVLESFQSRKPNIETCWRYGISEPTLYKWRQTLVDGGQTLFEGGGRAKIQALQEENQQLRQALAELALVNRRLRTRPATAADSNGIVTRLFRDAADGPSASAKRTGKF